MSEEAITQARQLFSSPMFTTQRSSSVLQTRPTACHVPLATPASTIPNKTTSKFCRPTQHLLSSRPSLNSPVFQTMNSTNNLRKN